MCFSPEADLLAGIVIGAAGIDGIRHVHRSQQFPLAVLPLVFAAHQLDEALVWWGLEGHVSEQVQHAATWIYLVTAFGVLPVLAPLAVAFKEKGPRRTHMFGFAALGAVIASVLTYAVVRGPITATIDGHHIAYRVDLWQGTLLVALYVVATCGAFLCSSHPHIRIFGVANLVVVGLLALLQANALISLWCAWAAIASIALALHLRLEHPDHPRWNRSVGSSEVLRPT